MKKLIVIKYGELTTKKDNINFFLKTLQKNIEKTLVDYNFEIKYDKGRMFIFADEKYLEDIINKLKNVFGIHEIIIGYELIERDFEVIEQNLLELIKTKEFATFKVETKRSDKDYPLTSMEMNRKLGGSVLKNKPNIRVDVHNPEVLINIEIRTKAVYIYFDRISGYSGFPLGSLGKGLLMLSGGIDSPVAGFLTMSRGVKLECVYFESPPHTSLEARNKVVSLVEKLVVYNYETKLHIINFTEIQEAIYKNIPHEYLITIMRRMMYRLSQLIAKNNRCHVLVNGESIGQVASQTLTSMATINECIKMPVIRPVSCFNKNEIIKIARDIDTYEISIQPYEDCCTIFVPEHPVINPEMKKVMEYEELIPIEELIYRAFKNHEVIKIGNKKKNDDIL